jgi:hypothetical protein
MAGGIERLTDKAVRSFAAKPGAAKKKKLFDGLGLFVTVTPAGSAVWRLKYRLGGKDRIYSIGTYPEIGLADARRERDAARALIRDGLDPVQERQIRRVEAAHDAGDTFGSVAETWLARRRRDWSAIHYQKSREAFERDVLPVIGRLPIRNITPAIVANVVEKILERDVRDTAVKIHQHITAVFRYAQARGMRDDNPATPARELIPKRRTVVRRPALLDIEALRDVLRRADVVAISPAVGRGPGGPGDSAWRRGLLLCA